MSQQGEWIRLKQGEIIPSGFVTVITGCEEIPISLHARIQRIRNKRNRRRIIKRHKRMGIHFHYQVACYYQFKPRPDSPTFEQSIYNH